MRRHIAHGGEATGLPACAGASVRLRLSVADRMLLVLRWTLTLAGAVVVLWIGSAFLATPASAAAVPATAVSAGVLKGGISNSADRPKKDGRNSDKKKSGDDKKKSGEDKKKPGDDKKKPGEDKKKPGEDKKKPGEDKKKPGEDKKKPGEERK